jgi:hypothetical protein
MIVSTRGARLDLAERTAKRPLTLEPDPGNTGVGSVHWMCTELSNAVIARADLAFS